MLRLVPAHNNVIVKVELEAEALPVFLFFVYIIVGQTAPSQKRTFIDFCSFFATLQPPSGDPHFLYSSPESIMSLACFTCNHQATFIYTFIVAKCCHRLCSLAG